MKTIKERAKEYSLKDFNRFYTGREKAVEEGYIAGAEEQRKIDIDKAERAFSEACGWLNVYPWYIAVKDEFRKAMKE